MEWRMCPVKEKCGRTFGVLLFGGTIFKGEWLVAMAKVAGQMLLVLRLLRPLLTSSLQYFPAAAGP